jgi:hypothetical protein
MHVAPPLEAAQRESSGLPRPMREPRLPGYVVLIALGALSLFLGVRPIGDQSAFLHLSIGRQLVDHSGFGRVDPWVPWAAKPYIPTEWLPGVAAYKLHEVFGLSGIAWLRAAGILLLLAATIWGARRVADTLPALIASGAALVGAGHALTARPQLLGFVFLSLALVAWWKMAGDLRPRWWLVPLTWVWASSHGLWVVGVGLGVVTVAGLALDRRLTWATARRLLAVPALSLVAAALTPVGPALLLTPLTVGRDVRDFVGEWQASSAHDPATFVTLCMLALVALSWARSRRLPPWWQVAHLVVAFVATLAMERTIAIGAVVAAPLLAQTLQDWRGTPAAALPRRDTLAWLAMGISALLIAAPLAATLAAQPVDVPTGLQPALSNLPAGTVVLEDINMSAWAGWVAPQLRPIEDSRSEIFSRQQHLDYARLVAAATGWDTILARSGATWALVRTGSPLAAALQERKSWETVGTDHAYSMMRRPR